MRIFTVAGSGNANHFQHVLGHLFAFGFGDILVQHDHFHDLISHTHGGVQGGHRVLEHHGHFGPAYLLHLALGQLKQIHAVQENLTAADVSRRIGKDAHDGLCDGGLTSAGLAHQTDGLALFQFKGDSVNRLNHTAIGGIFDNKVFDL